MNYSSSNVLGGFGRQVVQASLDVLVVVVDLLLKERSLGAETLERCAQAHHFLFPSLPIQPLVAYILRNRHTQMTEEDCCVSVRALC